MYFWEVIMGSAHDEICSWSQPDEHVSQWIMVSELHDKADSRRILVYS